MAGALLNEKRASCQHKMYSKVASENGILRAAERDCGERLWTLVSKNGQSMNVREFPKFKFGKLSFPLHVKFPCSTTTLYEKWSRRVVCRFARHGNEQAARQLVDEGMAYRSAPPAIKG